MPEDRPERAARARHAPPEYDIAEPSLWAAKNIGGSLLLAAAVLVSGVTGLTDLRHEPFPPSTRLINYLLSGLVAVAGLLLVRTRRRVPPWVINVLPSIAAVLICIPTSVDDAPSPLGPLLLTWPVTFAAAVLSARVAWCTLGVTAAAFGMLASVSRGVDGLTLWVEVTASVTVICWMVVRLQGQSLRLREALTALARTDPLTGLVNRRGFDDAHAREQTRHRRGGPPLSLLLVDIDHFKAVNDSWGHPAGDNVLRRLGQLLSTGFRAMDVVGRVGGEEFAVLIPDCTIERAYTRAVELCDTVRTETGTWEHPITVSVGAATIDDPETTSAELFAAADGALYAAKDGGRDRAARA
jgi:diguanylate cyclase (GGDEF)-like protein